MTSIITKRGQTLGVNVRADGAFEINGECLPYTQPSQVDIGADVDNVITPSFEYKTKRRRLWLEVDGKRRWLLGYNVNGNVVHVAYLLHGKPVQYRYEAKP